MKLQTKALLGVGAVLACAFLLTAAEYYHREVGAAEATALREARDLDHFLHALRTYYERGFAEAGIPINEETLPLLPYHATGAMAGELARWRESGIRFNNVSDRPMNPANRADGLEARAIERFRADPTLGELFLPAKEASGEQIYLYATPIRVEAPCLRCHGVREEAPPSVQARGDEAFGYRVGDLRGIVSIRVPRAPVEARAMAFFRHHLLIQSVAFLAIFLLLDRLVRRLFTTPLARLSAGLEGVAGGDYGHRLELPAAGEMATVATAFNRMAAEIARRQRALSESTAEVRQLAALVEQATEEILITDTDLKIAYANPASERVTGYAVEEMVGRNPCEVRGSHRDSTFVETLKATLARGEAWHGDCEGRRKDGSELIEEVAIFPIREGDRSTHYALLARDVTHERSLEAQLRQAQKMEVIGQLAGGIAHDFNNLLTGILGNLSLVRMELPPPEIAEPLAEAEKAAHRSARLVSQLLSFSRKSRVEFRPVDLNGLVTEAASLARKTLDRRIEIRCELGDDLPGLLADETPLQSAVINLCINGRDAILAILDGDGCPERRGDTFHIDLTTAARNLTSEQCAHRPYAHPGQYLLLSVADNGTGIPRELRERIFEPFFTTKGVGKGTGLGLASAFGVIRQHSGWIEVASEVGRFTRFDLYLPAVCDAATTAPVPADGATPTTHTGGTILLVDDERIIRNLGRTILERFGYTVETFSDGAAAVARYKEAADRFDLVIVDLSMPKMGGHEVIAALRAINPEVTVLVSSGYAPDGVTGLDDIPFVAKPYRVAELAAAVQKVITSRR